MKDCRGAPKVTGRVMSVDVTPDSKAGPKVD
jgi:cytochrome c